MKHDSAADLKSILPIRRAFAVLSIVLSFVLAFAAFGVPVNTSWTYQGQLRRSGTAYTGTCNFQFSLWDAASAGTQQASTLSINSVNVVNGLFTVTLDFGEGPSPIGIGDTFFTGAARWLGTSVQCSGDGGFTPLDPRQAITAAPYALSLRPGATIEGVLPERNMLFVNNSSISGYGISGSGGEAGVFGSTSRPGGRGVWGYGEGAGSAGVFGYNELGAAISGYSGGTGYAGQFIGPVLATNSRASGIGVDSSSYIGVQGKTTGSNGTGVFGDARNVTSGYGVVGRGDTGVYGEASTTTGRGVWGSSTSNGPAIFGENTGGGFAGQFQGSVSVQGNLFVGGTLFKSSGSFRIDHPLDPEHKFLSHSFVESPDMKNIYDGTVTTDATGSATVTLPAYFAALNRDYRYQLTVLGQFAQAIVSRKIIADNTFAIRTDKPGVEVSWQVTGIRQDAYAKENPIVVEQAKSAEEDGRYLYPAGFGAGEEKRIGHSNGRGPGNPDGSGAGQGDQ